MQLYLYPLIPEFCVQVKRTGEGLSVHHGFLDTGVVIAEFNWRRLNLTRASPGPLSIAESWETANPTTGLHRVGRLTTYAPLNPMTTETV